VGLSVDDLIGRVKVPVRSVTIVLDASLLAEYDELREQLDATNRNQGRMGQANEALELAQRMAELEDQMRTASAKFQFKGISKNRLNVLIKKHPPKKGSQSDWDVDAGSVDFVAACSHEPEMTEDEAGRLCDALAQGQWEMLFKTAWAATKGDGSVPFSARASELISQNASR
jgi:hypothetical protein